MKILLRTTLGLLLGASLAVPAYADSVTCADGTASVSGRGACSHHGGIAKDEPDAKKPDAEKSDRTDAAPTRTRAHTKPAPIDRRAERHEADRERDRDAAERSERASTPADREGAPRAPRSDDTGAPTARCKDGHLSHSTHHSGTCSGHGGVAEWLVD